MQHYAHAAPCNATACGVILATVQELANADLVAANLRRIRGVKSLTVEALARESGVSVRTIAYIESGDGNPRLSILDALAGALDVPVVDLLSEPVEA